MVAPAVAVESLRPMQRAVDTLLSCITTHAREREGERERETRHRGTSGEKGGGGMGETQVCMGGGRLGARRMVDGEHSNGGRGERTLGAGASREGLRSSFGV